ncbi:helix-turn-helix transcriptional regulator [Paenibacillus psychroresistens]|nr:helix-turn-helix transcriptional regulator [Paenibacillus psychroresistens]
MGQAILAYRKRQNMTQQDFAQAIPMDRSVIARIESGDRKAAKVVMKRVSTCYDDPQLMLAAQEEVTDGACTPWLDGADLHKSTVQLKTEEELSEAQAAMRLVPITKRKDQLTEVDMIAIKSAIMECIEAITALTHYVAVLCKEFAFSWLALWKEHRRELKVKKYMK